MKKIKKAITINSLKAGLNLGTSFLFNKVNQLHDVGFKESLIKKRLQMLILYIEESHTF